MLYSIEESKRKYSEWKAYRLQCEILKTEIKNASIEYAKILGI